MKKIIHIPLYLLLCLSFTLQAQDVPSTVYYCDVEIKLSPDAQNRIQEYYRQIVASPRYFNEMVKRAQIYMPFIEEAFSEVQIPHDLKFLAIQESALRADVVSSSKAVGFWQMKEGTASDLNLQIDGDIDERMHIYRSSHAAANYLKEANRGYANWVYALLSYYEGPTGSVPYTNPDYYGETVMNLSGNDHWYVLKAIANKLAYQKALSSNKRPDLFLMPFVASAGTPIKSILDKHQIEEEDFFRYNKWIHNKKRISRKKDYTYYLPRSGSSYIGHVPDPVKMNQSPTNVKNILADSPPVGDLHNLQRDDAPEPEIIYSEGNRAVKTSNSFPASSGQAPLTATSSKPPIFSPKAKDIPSQASGQFVEFQLRHDLHYGLEYVEFTGFTRIAEIADRYKKDLASFLLYNGLIPGEEPKIGKLVYIEKPEKRSYHIVQEGESLTDIAADYVSTVARIQNRNRMNEGNFTVYIGQKLYLKDRKPKEEKIIILSTDVREYVSEEEEEILGQIAAENEEDKQEAPELDSQEKLVEATPIPEASNKAIDPKTVEEVPISQPKPEESLISEKGAPTPTEIKPVWIEHIVIQGETLWQLSKKYGTEVDLIIKINKLENDQISQGQYLRILATKKF